MVDVTVYLNLELSMTGRQMFLDHLIISLAVPLCESMKSFFFLSCG